MSFSKYTIESGKPMERWVENGETVFEDNGDDWKLKIVGASSAVTVPCDESEVLTNDDWSSIPDDVSSIDFGDCITQIDCSISTSLGSSENPATVHFGDNVEVIGNGSDGILNGYLKYDKDSFDDNLRIINNHAFSSGYNTYSSNTASLRSKIESIGDNAFYNSNANLNTLKIETEEPPSIGTNAFYFGFYFTNRMNCILVPGGSVDTYKSAWYEHRGCIYSLADKDTFYRATYSNGTSGLSFSSEGTDGVLDEHMVKAPYEGNFEKSITDVYLSNEVKRIGDDAFYGCTSLTSLTTPNSVTSIGSRAFGYCSGLTSITFFNPIKNGEIDTYAFEYCRGLRRIDIGSGVTKIGDMAFFGIITHDASDDNYFPLESDIVVYCYATTPPEVRIGDISNGRNSPFVYDGNIMTNGNSDYLFKPVVYVPCSSLVAYRASKWNDICVLKPIKDDCDERWETAQDTIVSTSGSNPIIIESWVTDMKYPQQIRFDKNTHSVINYCWVYFKKTDGSDFLSMPSSTEHYIKINDISYCLDDTNSLPSYVTYENNILTVDLNDANVYGDVYLHSYEKNFLIGNVYLKF